MIDQSNPNCISLLYRLNLCFGDIIDQTKPFVSTGPAKIVLFLTFVSTSPMHSARILSNTPCDLRSSTMTSTRRGSSMSRGGSGGLWEPSPGFDISSPENWGAFPGNFTSLGWSVSVFGLLRCKCSKNFNRANRLKYEKPMCLNLVWQWR